MQHLITKFMILQWFKSQILLTLKARPFETWLRKSNTGSSVGRPISWYNASFFKQRAAESQRLIKGHLNGRMKTWRPEEQLGLTSSHIKVLPELRGSTAWSAWEKLHSLLLLHSVFPSMSPLYQKLGVHACMTIIGAKL